MANLVTLATIFAILAGISHSIRVSNPSNPDFVSLTLTIFWRENSNRKRFRIQPFKRILMVEVKITISIKDP